MRLSSAVSYLRLRPVTIGFGYNKVNIRLAWKTCLNSQGLARVKLYILLSFSLADKESTSEWSTFKILHSGRLQSYPPTLNYSGKACKGQTLLLWKFVNYGQKKFYNIDTWTDRSLRRRSPRSWSLTVGSTHRQLSVTGVIKLFVAILFHCKSIKATNL